MRNLLAGLNPEQRQLLSDAFTAQRELLKEHLLAVDVDGVLLLQAQAKVVDDFIKIVRRDDILAKNEQNT